MARFYISSTYKDLVEERNLVWNALSRLNHDARGMEGYAAADERPVDKCIADVRRCDGYIGLIASRYGYVPEGYDGKSITRLEYEEASRRGLKRLMFLFGTEGAPPPEPGVVEFRQLVQEAHVVKAVATPEQLRAEVIAAVANAFGSGEDIPPLLPYLCDRGPQMEELKKAFEKSFDVEGDGRPLVVIVHGDDREAHSMFVERVRLHFLPKVWRPVGRRSTAVKRYALSWPTPWGDGASGSRMLGEVGQVLNTSPQPARILDAIAKIPGLSLFESHVLTSDCQRDGPDTIRYFVDFWERLVSTAATLPPLLVMLSVKFKRASIWPFDSVRRTNARMQEIVAQMAQRPMGAIRALALPPLESIYPNHGQAWAQMDETRELCEGDELEAYVR
ncbi:MAG TPA: DUF4062 domain-containing protein, partial [Polyangiaceae bacterium]|nr:DUF4062 domain-containing protein [Polyangiaceae bacterium]